MKQSYSTKQLAKMWDVSESTVKRWADAGMLKCRKTIGGHRKFELEDIVEFQNQCDLAKKGIIAGNKPAECDGELKRFLDESDFVGLANLYKQAALAGKSSLVTSLFSQSSRRGLSLATIGEEIIRPAMQEVGKLWRAGRIGVLDEHLATFSTIEGLTALQSGIAKGESNQRAIVGCSEGELHELASILVRGVLEAEGWNVTYLGSHTPLFSFAEAVSRFKPQAVCVSITMVDNIERAIRDYDALRRAASKRKTKVVIGGAALKNDEVRSRFRDALYADTLQDLLKIVTSDKQ